MILRILMSLALAAVLFGTYVRVVGSNPEDWHIDPVGAEAPGGLGYLVTVEQSPVWQESPREVIGAMQRVALASPRTVLLAGSAEEAHITLESRSLIWGFPDYTSIRAVEVEGGTALAILGRARFGANDLGVNKARIEGWLVDLSEALPPQ